MPTDPSRGPEHGYVAHLNLVLPGHSPQTVAGVDVWQTHHFDVHGTEDRVYVDFSDGLPLLPDDIRLDGHDGWAGETIDVANNSFLGMLGSAFKVRATPADAAYFYDNALPASIPFPGNDAIADAVRCHGCQPSSRRSGLAFQK